MQMLRGQIQHRHVRASRCVELLIVTDCLMCQAVFSSRHVCYAGILHAAMLNTTAINLYSTLHVDLKNNHDHWEITDALQVDAWLRLIQRRVFQQLLNYFGHIRGNLCDSCCVKYIWRRKNTFLYDTCNWLNYVNKYSVMDSTWINYEMRMIFFGMDMKIRITHQPVLILVVSLQF